MNIHAVGWEPNISNIATLLWYYSLNILKFDWEENLKSSQLEHMVVTVVWFSYILKMNMYYQIMWKIEESEHGLYLQPQSEKFQSLPNRHSHSWVSSHIHWDIQVLCPDQSPTSIWEINKIGWLICFSTDVGQWFSIFSLIQISCFVNTVSRQLSMLASSLYKYIKTQNCQNIMRSILNKGCI